MPLLDDPGLGDAIVPRLARPPTFPAEDPGAAIRFVEPSRRLCRSGLEHVGNTRRYLGTPRGADLGVPDRRADKTSQRGNDAEIAARQGAQRGSPLGRYTESLAPHFEQVPASHVLTRRLPVTQPAV